LQKEPPFNYSGPVKMQQLKSLLINRELHKINDWEEVLPPFSNTDGEPDVDASPGKIMNRLFGVGNYEPSVYVR
jgi:lipoate-protein ligase A